LGNYNPSLVLEKVGIAPLKINICQRFSAVLTVFETWKNIDFQGAIPTFYKTGLGLL